MTASVQLWCCPHFRREVEAAIARCPELAGLTLNCYSVSCLQGMQQGQGPLAGLDTSQGEELKAIVGGGCLRGDGLGGEDQECAVMLAPPQCFHLVAPSALVDSLLAEGAYLLTPGWLEHWREHLATWGFNRATARQFFQESITKLVLLDTGGDPEGQANLVALAAHLGLPWQVIPVGLDLLQLHLERLILDLRHRAKALPPPDQFFADHLMVIDTMNYLLSAGGENEALKIVDELFRLLFAPGRLRFLAPGELAPDATLPTEDDFAWTTSGRGFVVPLRHQDQDLGALWLDDLAFAEYRERYLALALPLAKVCALAMASARAQEARQKAERAIQGRARIVESSGDAIIGKDLEGTIFSWNQGATRRYGFREDEVLGKNISFLIPHDQPDQMPRLLEGIKAGRSVDQVETVWQAKDGSLSDVSLQVSPILDENGKVVGASSIARDITKEKQKTEQDRRALEAQLMQAQKLESVGRLAGGVAHDFNNMLAIILGYADLALQALPPDGELSQNLGEIQHAAEQAQGLTRQLLAFARKQVLQVTRLDLNQTVKGFGKMIKRLIGEDIEVKKMLAKNLPAIDADPALVEQVLMNLAVNARDAMPNGGTLTLETKAVKLDQGYIKTRLEVTPGDYVMLAVSDTGAGMDEATRRMIFEPFFTTKGPGEGTGLGLATVYGIVKQHGGSIWVYSEPGQGTTFKLYFPAAQTEGAAVVKPAEILAPSGGGGETLLVVEDDPGLRELICAALVRQGYEVLCTGSPDEATAVAKGHLGTIHLMLIDVVLPGMNGKQLHEAIAPLRPEVKVLFMSGYTENVVAHRGVLQDGINFIQKPFTIKQLAAKLESILHRPPATA